MSLGWFWFIWICLVSGCCDGSWGWLVQFLVWVARLRVFVRGWGLGVGQVVLGCWFWRLIVIWFSLMVWGLVVDADC